jgi:hypothetical protein
MRIGSKLLQEHGSPHMVSDPPTSSLLAAVRRLRLEVAALIGAKTAAVAPLLAAAAAMVVNSPSAAASPWSARQAGQVHTCAVWGQWAEGVGQRCRGQQSMGHLVRVACC